MVDVIAFPSIRPKPGMAKALSALPYDVFSLDEAKAEIKRNPQSFLRIDMAEATFDHPIDHNDDAVFERSRKLLDEAIADGSYIVDDEPRYYLYRLCSPEGPCQTGIVGCASIDDYQRGAIKKHEKTRADKELNRIRHVDIVSAQTGPIFLTFRSDGIVEQVMERTCATPPLYDFTADDGVKHTVWRVEAQEDAQTIKQALEQTPYLYIADGHHRAASAVKAGLLRRETAAAVSGEAQQGSTEARGAQPPQLASDHFLSVIFPSDQLTILDYNRVVSDLNGLSVDEFLAAVREGFAVSEPQKEAFKPDRKGAFGMHLDGSWYCLVAKDSPKPDAADPVATLDVTILQDRLLGPILGIEDPRSDPRIDFVGGIRGLGELERRAATDMRLAFSLYPTSIEELFAVADADLLMPPKSTWFEPKLRSGIFIHRI